MIEKELVAVVTRKLEILTKEVSGLKEEISGGFYTMREFNERSGLSVKTIQRLCREKLLKATQVDKGCQWMIDKSELVRLKEEAQKNFKPRV